MKDLFFSLADHAIAQLRGKEVLLANFAGEVSDFVRFNHARVRQPMTIRQARLDLSLIDGQRRDNCALTLTGVADEDRAQVAAAVAAMRADLPSLPEDPFLLYSTDATQSNRETAGALPKPEDAIDAIVTYGRGLDMVGHLASGPVLRGFASSLGARHWHAVDAFLFDWSLYHATDKAVKGAWAGAHFDRNEFARRIDATRETLRYLALPARTIAPGKYRAYLAPAALDELLWMLNWEGVSAKAQRTKTSCLQRLVDGEAGLSPLVSLAEDTASGLAPAFDASGFTKPARVGLVSGGKHAGSMVSARTAKEYAIDANGADDGEGMQSMALAGGSLPEQDALAALDTGIAVGNLNYLNFSDRANGRITGLTRFATFWVEHGQIVAPVNVMRWDDSVFRLLGTQLEALTDTPEWIMNNLSYEQRSVQTSRVPGALLAGMAFTL
jgi:predicted Zn-dependent protease